MTDVLSTWEGGHALVVEAEDDQLLKSRCQCGVLLNVVTPDQPIDSLCVRWNRHVMTLLARRAATERDAL